MIPPESQHISDKEAASRDYTTDLFGLPIKVGDSVKVFRDGADGYTNTKTTHTYDGVITKIEVWPTTIAEVTVDHYEMCNAERLDPNNYRWAKEREISRFYNTSVLGDQIFRDTVPEYFL